MAFPSDTFTGDAGDLDVFIPAVWGQKMNDFFRSNLVAANFFTDRSEEIRDGGNIIYTPNITEISANSKSAATAVTLATVRGFSWTVNMLLLQHVNELHSLWKGNQKVWKVA